MKIASVLGGSTGFLLGFAAALIFCWFAWVRPLQGHLDSREQALGEWERLHRLERESIGAIKNLSTEEVRKWVATADEQNERFANLERLAHEQELRLVGPSLDLVVVAAVVVLGVVGLVVFLLRDANAAAAVTLDVVAALAPEQAVRAAFATRPPRSQGAAGLTLTTARPTASRSSPEPLAVETTRAQGVVCKYDSGDGFGWIQLADESELFFHRNDVVADDRHGLRSGWRVSFRRGQDGQGRFFALEVRVVERP